MGKKAHIGTYKNDEEFDGLFAELHNAESKLNKLTKETHRNIKAHKSLINHNEQLAQQFLTIFQPTLGNSKYFEASDGNLEIPSDIPLQTHEEREKFEKESSKREIVDKYCQLIADMSPAIDAELQLMEEKIVKTVQELLHMIKQIKKMAKEREFVLLDVDKHMSSLEKHKNKKEQTEKTEEQIRNLESKLEKSSQNFEEINSTMKRELPYFFKMVSQLMTPLTEVMYWSFNIVNYQYFQIINMMKSDYHISDETFDFDKCTEIMDEATNRHFEVNKRVKELSIIGFSKNYLQHLTSNADASFEKKEEEEAHIRNF